MSIYGTSNVHDWSEHVNGIQGDISMNLENNVITKISSLMFTTKVVDIKSGKGTMDDYTHEALKFKLHPQISYKSTDITIQRLTTPEGAYKVSSSGRMNIAGFEKTENIEATCNYIQGKLKCEGKKKIDMTSFGVEPPSIMFGAMTVGKEVEVHFDIEYQ